MPGKYPEKIETVEELEEQLSAPDDGVIETMRRLEGDLIILGAAGKMGPTLTRMAKRASDAAGVSRRITAVSRFSAPDAEDAFRKHGIETIRCNLLGEEALNALPDAPNVAYMAGMKFGAAGNEALTWAMNCFLPGMVCRKYRNSRIAAFSTGNIYGTVPVSGGGSRETDVPRPEGDYAMSCLGRERIFEHFSRALDIPVTMIRLNYACELRYGVLVDIAAKVWRGETVDVTMGYFNTIWQRDANALFLRALEHAAAPPFLLNLTGPDTLSARALALDFAKRMGREAQLSGEEAPDALLSNAARCRELFGPPETGPDRICAWITDWIMRGGALLDKPTHFEVRDGKF
jgi:hypothetical protein